MASVLSKIRLQLRRWSAGKAGAPWPRQTSAERETDTPINTALEEQQGVLRTKAINEAANNAFVEGCIGTHQEDWIGPNGPTLRVFSEDNEYNQRLEEVWRKWFCAPCVDPRVSGAALLKLWVRKLWDCGEFVAQRVTRKEHAGTIKLRLKPIHPRRLVSPLGPQSNVLCGIEVDDDNVPLAYYIAPPSDRWLTGVNPDSKRVPARDIIHEFPLIEEDQLRGVPFLSPCVDSITDMREYDEHVTEAADTAAKLTVVWKSTHEDAPYFPIAGASTSSVARGSHSCGPTGWEPMQLQPGQPGAKWAEHRKEKQAEIGRPVGMPLLAVRQDASNHNYSSARYDSLGYWRRVLGFQMWLGGSVENRGILYDLVHEIALEAAAEIGPPPADVRYEFLWPKPPQIDDEKAAKAEEIALRNKTLSFIDALSNRGKTLPEHIEQLAREQQAFEDAGLEYPTFGAVDAGGDDEEDIWDGEKGTEEKEE